MDKEKFVKIIKYNVRDNLLTEFTKILSNPPGRSPEKELKDLSVWYNSLKDEDKKTFRKSARWF